MRSLSSQPGLRDAHDRDFGASKLFGNFSAVRDLSFRVGPGEVLGLVGPNGAGKTTTLRTLAGIIPPSSGGVIIGGHDLLKDPINAKRHLAFFPMSPGYSTTSPFASTSRSWRGSMACAITRRSR